jgi:peptidoglycan hydrolase-like protein with peptidoglycan-binding domain
MFRSLLLGSRGQDVLAVQQGLNLRRAPQDEALTEDGVFGPETDAAVREFQHRNSLPATGIVGPLTRSAIFPLAVGTARAIGMSSPFVFSHSSTKARTGGLSGEPGNSRGHFN